MTFFQNYIPPVGFYFTASIDGETGFASFQEVSGISTNMETKIKEGGENRFVHKVPGRVKYDNLVLKRGLMGSSSFKTWVANTLKSGFADPIKPKTVIVQLIDANSPTKAIMTWTFHDAYPVKWDVSSIKSDSNEMMVESLELSYSYFDQKS